jgi:hypothetical protein
MLSFSGTLDLALSLLSVALAWQAARWRNDFLFAGFGWVAAAAFAGAFNLSGYHWTNQTHVWLSQVSRGPGMFALALGILASLYGPVPASRWLAPAWSIVGAAMVTLHEGHPSLNTLNTMLGACLLLALLVVVVQAFRESRQAAAGTALAAIVLMIVIGFAVSSIPLPADGPIRHVDLLHLLLMTAYLLIWYSLSLMRTASSVTD